MDNLTPEKLREWAASYEDNGNHDLAELCLGYASALERKRDEFIAVMHFVDKWLDVDELKEPPANRANTAREKSLKAIEAAEQQRDEAIEAFGGLKDDHMSLS